MYLNALIRNILKVAEIQYIFPYNFIDKGYFSLPHVSSDTFW